MRSILRTATPAAALLCLCLSLPARADPTFGAHDIRTLFFIAKSNDRNRVDYGIHLDEACRPTSDEPLYAYWRRFEPGATAPLGDLNPMDRTVYGIDYQEVEARSERGSRVVLDLAALPGEGGVEVLVGALPGACHAEARAPIAGRPAILEYVFVQLHSPLSVDFILVRGRDVETGGHVFERREPPRDDDP